MNLVEVTDFLVKSVVKEPDLVSVTKYDEDDTIVLEVLVSSKDMPYLIGRSGNVASAIRTIVIAASFTEENRKKIKINFDSF
jgi:hypothetical protein